MSDRQAYRPTTQEIDEIAARFRQASIDYQEALTGLATTFQNIVGTGEAILKAGGMHASAQEFTDTFLAASREQASLRMRVADNEERWLEALAVARKSPIVIAEPQNGSEPPESGQLPPS